MTWGLEGHGTRDFGCGGQGQETTLAFEIFNFLLFFWISENYCPPFLQHSRLALKVRRHRAVMAAAALSGAPVKGVFDWISNRFTKSNNRPSVESAPSVPVLDGSVRAVRLGRLLVFVVLAVVGRGGLGRVLIPWFS